MVRGNWVYWYVDYVLDRVTFFLYPLSIILTRSSIEMFRFSLVYSGHFVVGVLKACFSFLGLLVAVAVVCVCLYDTVSLLCLTWLSSDYLGYYVDSRIVRGLSTRSCVLCISV